MVQLVEAKISQDIQEIKNDRLHFGRFCSFL